MGRKNKKTKSRKIVGLVGEHPINDCEAIKHLLLKRYPKVDFKVLVKRQFGSQIDTRKTKKIIDIQLKKYAIDFIIFICDLDALPSNETQKRFKQQWFDKYKNSKADVFLLNIYELEALILADIMTFNQLYKARINFSGNPMFCKEPKELLKRKTYYSSKKYTESAAVEIFKHLSIQTIMQNCSYFNNFIELLDKKL